MESKTHHTTPAATRRQRQIEECLRDRMLNTPYHMITVSELCRDVGISRRGFYKYYRDKNACLYALFDRVIRGGYVRSMSGGKMSLLEACTVHLQFWTTRKKLLDAIVKQNMIGLFRDRVVQYFLEDEHSLEKLLTTPEIAADMDILSAYVSIRISLLFSWHARGFDTPAEEMAKKYLRMAQPLLQFGEEGTYRW